jgi:hypothetical protein
MRIYDCRRLPIEKTEGFPFAAPAGNRQFKEGSFYYDTYQQTYNNDWPSILADIMVWQMVIIFNIIHGTAPLRKII